MTAGALGDGYSPEHASSTAPRRCASATATSRTTSPAPTATSASRRPSRSPATPSSTGSGSNFWQKYGSDVADVDAKDPLVEEAKEFGFGSTTGIDIPGEATGRIADRKWKLAYYESMKDYYCEVGEEHGLRLPAPLRPRVLRRGLRLPRRRRGQLRHRPGRHRGHAAAAGPRVRRARQRRHALRAQRRQGDRRPGRRGGQGDRAEGPGEGRRPAERPRLHRRRPAERAPRSAPWPGGCWSSRSTRSRSAPRPARPRSTASSRPRGWRPTPRTTSW